MAVGKRRKRAYKPRLTEKQVNSMKKDFEAGTMGIYEIAEKYNVTYMGLQHWVEKGNWEYGSKKNDYIESLRQTVSLQLAERSADIVLDHVNTVGSVRNILVSEINKDEMDHKRINSIVNAVKGIESCIKIERLCVNLPGEVSHKSVDSTIKTVNYESLLKDISGNAAKFSTVRDIVLEADSEVEDAEVLDD